MGGNPSRWPGADPGVAVEHRGWEALTEEQLAADCALPGGYAGGSFDRGWARILGCLAAAVDDGAPAGDLS